MDDPNNRGWYQPERLQAHAESEARRAEQRRPALSPPAEGSGYVLSGNPFGTGLSEPKLVRTPTPAPVDWLTVGPKLVEALEGVRDWIRYELPVPTDNATTMLGRVNTALAAAQPSPGAEDTIDGLESDLRQAVLCAYLRGAKDWAVSNYPSWREWLESHDDYATPAQPDTGDVAALREARFLLDRLAEFENEDLPEEALRSWCGHVVPSKARLIAALSKPNAPGEA